jgi:GxxExxY protein
MKRELPDERRRTQLLEKELTGIVIRSFYETYNVLGFGFLEAVYRNALARELRDAGLHVLQETPVDVTFKGARVGTYRLDLLVQGKIAIEVKATTLLGPTDRRQLINYLRATSLDVGLLLHYGPEPEFHRLVSPRIALGARSYE